jgi:hypothetical protein
LSLFGELSFTRIPKKPLNTGKGKWKFWKSKKAVEALNKNGNVSFNHEQKENEKNLMIKIVV